MTKPIFVFLAAAMLGLSACSPKPSLTASGLDPKAFEDGYNGAATALYTLRNASGMEVCITNFGGRIVSVTLAGKDKRVRDVVLGFDKVKDYFPENHQSDFGAAIGRYANRIAGGRFTLDGKEYILPQNNGENCLHGGTTGWQYQVYTAQEADERHLKLVRVSPDGDNGFPGKVEATVTYTLTDDNRIDIAYEAVTDAPTVINMTNHAYFNLSGDPAGHLVTEDILQINASAFTPVDKSLIPLGENVPVQDTPMDFRIPRPIGPSATDTGFEQIAIGNGLDHNWVLDTAGDIGQVAAELYCPESGIGLQVYTTEPGIQVYSGNFLDGTVTGKKGIAYPQRSAICLETQHFPDSPNQEAFPSTVLRPGEKYQSRCIFAFFVR